MHYMLDWVLHYGKKNFIENSCKKKQFLKEVRIFLKKKKGLRISEKCFSLSLTHGWTEVKCLSILIHWGVGFKHLSILI
jgi:hypothetical protein